MFLLFLAISQLILVQETYSQDDSGNKIEKLAKDLVRKYQSQLVMNKDQLRLFEEKVTEFLSRAEKIRNLDIPDSEKTHMLSLLHEQETAEMDGILTRPQLKRYQRMKPLLQPIE